MLSRLVRDGLADIQPRTMRAGGRTVTVVRLTITDASNTFVGYRFDGNT
jgi:hypothetical protein